MIAVSMFLIGTILGSFYNVVASRITEGKSIVNPPSHCSNCNHVLKSFELIPIFSYFLQGGKCSNCKIKLSIFYPISEIISGLLFMISFLVFGLSLELIIALTFVSLLIIIVLSDIYYMIIEDVVLIFFGLLLSIEIYFINGLESLLTAIFAGIVSFLIMLTLKFMGDFLFKKESLGGGDIKLMLVLGLVIGIEGTLITIFLSAFIALPVALIFMKNENHEIPYGPFLGLASLIIYFAGVDLNFILNLVGAI